jgi:hypothetical protein
VSLKGWVYRSLDRKLHGTFACCFVSPRHSQLSRTPTPADLSFMPPGHFSFPPLHVTSLLFPARRLLRGRREFIMRAIAAPLRPRKAEPTQRSRAVEPQVSNLRSSQCCWYKPSQDSQDHLPTSALDMSMSTVRIQSVMRQLPDTD